MKINRRRALAGLAAAFIGTGTAAATTNITWWDFFTGGDGIRMKAMIKKFNDTHKNIHIKATTLAWGTPFYTKVQTSTMVGRGPDMMTYHISRIPLGVSQHTLRPFTMAELHSVGLHASDYPPEDWKHAHVNGKLYAVPLDIHSIVLFYNKDILKKDGMLGANGQPEGLNGLNNFNAALAKIKKDGSKYAVSVATGNGPTVWRVFYTMLAQQKGAFLSDGKVLPGADLSRAEVATATMANWVKQGWAPKLTGYAASIALFTSGQAAFMINGDWEVPTMVDLAKKHKLGFGWGAVQIPTWFAQQATWADSHSFAIPNRRGHKLSPKKLKDVLTIISWMDHHSIMWAAGGHIPAFGPVRHSQAFKTMQPNATYASLLKTAHFEPVSTITGVASPTYDASTNFLVPAVNGQIPVDKALKQLQQQLQSDLQ